MKAIVKNVMFSHKHAIKTPRFVSFFFFLPFESAARRRVFHTIAQRTCHAWIVCLADGSDHLSHRLLAKTINGNSLSLHCK